MQCPLCSNVTEVKKTGDEFVMSCSSGCLEKVCKPGKTVEEAKSNYEQFKIELQFGADMWGSKIRDGVAED